ncbi:MAG: transposase [Treponema sp.]|jgi:transposase|nr:transposase [Treponema sp.]
MGERREYTKAFKESAVEMVVSSGRKFKDVAGELGISPENLRRWRREAEEEERQEPQQASPGKENQQDKELARLRKEVADLRETNEILKKAVAIFSSNILR